MSTVSVTPSKRKIIDLKDDTFKTLSIMAIQKGTNLKNYIEDILNGIPRITKMQSSMPN